MEDESHFFVTEQRVEYCESPIRIKSFALAVRLYNLGKYLTETKKEFVISKQLMRSGTAIGALVREGINAESKPDFALASGRYLFLKASSFQPRNHSPKKTHNL